MRLAKKDGLDKEALLYFKMALEFVEETFHGLGFCLSQERDLLSQWRGYANDGKGFSIGFSRNYLDTCLKQFNSNKKRKFILHKVNYNDHDHDDQVRPVYQKIKTMFDDGSLKQPTRGGLLTNALGNDFQDEFDKKREDYKNAYHKSYYKIIELSQLLYVLKKHAFSEEKEWRLITYLIGEDDGSCSYRAAGNRIIPYLEIDFPSIDIEPITEVIIGPKNITPPSIIKTLLEEKGFHGVKVIQSLASYR